MNLIKSLLLLALAPCVFALPQFGDVIRGDAEINRIDSKNIVVKQRSNFAKIQWDDFQIEDDNEIRFELPDEDAVTVNTTFSGQPSLISGAVVSNGHLAVLNTAGIVFNQDSSLDLLSLVLSSLDADGAGQIALDHPHFKQPPDLKMLAARINIDGDLVAREVELLNRPTQSQREEFLALFDLIDDELGVPTSEQYDEIFIGGTLKAENVILNSGGVVTLSAIDLGDNGHLDVTADKLQTRPSSLASK